MNLAFHRLKNPSPKTLLALALILLVFTCDAAQAREHCSREDSYGQRRCQTGLSPSRIAHIAIQQEQPQWCWAASISMIFAHYGYHVRQEEIVRHGSADRPAASGQAMTNALSTLWTDEDSRGFQASALATDTPARQFQVTNEMVVSELIAGRPLLVGTLGHAMVLVNVKYQRLPSGAVRVMGGSVIDPQPGRGLRPLQLAEMRPTYIAAVQITPAEQ